MKRRIFLKKFLVCMILFFWTPFLCGLLFWKMEVKKAPKWEQNTENIRNFQVVPKRLAGFETWGKDEYEEFAKDFLYADGKLKRQANHFRPYRGIASFWKEKHGSPMPFTIKNFFLG